MLNRLELPATLIRQHLCQYPTKIQENAGRRPTSPLPSPLISQPGIPSSLYDQHRLPEVISLCHRIGAKKIPIHNTKFADSCPKNFRFASFSLDLMFPFFFSPVSPKRVLLYTIT